MQAHDLIRECQAALAVELAAWDIDPPLHHVKQAHDRCVEWLAAHPAPVEARVVPEQPIDMILHCPACGMQHIDKPDGRRLFADEPIDEQSFAPAWTNPPHRSHLCHGCGHIWRPADVPTNGVDAIKTKGKADAPLGGCAAPTPPAERVTLSDEQSGEQRIDDYVKTQ